MATLRQQMPSVVKTNAGRLRVDYRATLSIIPGEFVLRFLISHRDFFRGRLLDVGCGVRPYRLLYDRRVEQSFGMDVPHSLHGLRAVDVVASAGHIPFQDASFDTVLCTNVIEHVSDPDVVLSEIGRVLKPGGVLLLTAPFLYALHEQPYDFQRFTIYWLKERLGRYGFEILRTQAQGGFGTAVLFFLFLAVRTVVGLDKLQKPRWYDVRPVRALFAKWQLLYVALYERLFSGPKKDLESLTRSEQFGSLGYCLVARKVAC